MTRENVPEERVAKLVNDIGDRQQESEAVLERLKEFTSLLYAEIEKALLAVTEKSTNIEDNSKITSLSSGLKSLSFEWCRARITVLPITIAAFPASDAKVASICFREQLVGRVVIFYQPADDIMEHLVFGDIYVSPNGEWYASGIFEPTNEDSFDETRLGLFALSLLEALTHNIKRYHQAKERLQFDPNSQGFKNPIGFAPPNS